MKWLIRLLTHGAALAVGFAAGIYYLPILTAPDGPTEAQVQTAVEQAQFTAEIRRDLADSDALHWGEGTLFVDNQLITFEGELAPGPDYRLYLSPKFVETEAEFGELKSQMIEMGAVNTFENFMVSVPDGVDPTQYSAAIVWCEAFGQFITAGQYQ